MGQHDALALCYRAGKQQVSSERGLDIVLLCQSVGRVRTGDDLKQVDPALAGERRRVVLADEWLRAEPYVLFGHEHGGRLMHEMPVLDALDPRGDRSLDLSG